MCTVICARWSRLIAFGEEERTFVMCIYVRDGHLDACARNGFLAGVYNGDIARRCSRHRVRLYVRDLLIGGAYAVV